MNICANCGKGIGRGSLCEDCAKKAASPDPPPPVDLRALEALIVTWRERSYHDRLRIKNSVSWKAVAFGRDECVRELEALVRAAAPQRQEPPSHE